MTELDKEIKIGTKVLLCDIAWEGLVTISSINENRNLFQVEGFEGSFQAGHILDFKNEVKTMNKQQLDTLTDKILKEIQEIGYTDKVDIEGVAESSLEEHGITDQDRGYVLDKVISVCRPDYMADNVEELINQIEGSWTHFFDRYNNPAVKMLLNAVRGKKAWELAKDADEISFTEQTNIDIDKYIDDENIDSDDQDYLIETAWEWFE